MYKDKVDSQGNLTEKYLAWCRSNNYSSSAIALEQNKFQSEHERLKKLDEESPEEWIKYSAYDAMFTPEQRRQFNPDGTVNMEYLAKNRGIANVLEVESLKLIDEIAYFDMMCDKWAENGQNYSDYIKGSNDQMNREVGRKPNAREIADIRNGEEISSLTIDIDLDEYNDLQKF